MKPLPMQVPYGAVYFRKSNPPPADWERDYAVARKDGMNIFRHWFLWGAIETSPGFFDWGDYDRHMDLAAENKMQVIIAEMSAYAPEWVFRQHREHLHVTSEGLRVESRMSGSSATGGAARGNAGALCLDSIVSRELAGRFLKTLAERYKDHPALLGYDIWNECCYAPDLCYCEHTASKFRDWLKAKYKDLHTVNQIWHRYSYSEWLDIEIPKGLGPYQQSMDWLEFRRENFYGHMTWRRDLIREIDADCLIAAHGTAGSLTGMATAGSDEWEAASNVDVYGFTWVASRKGAEFWKLWHAADLTRSGARGKPFWHAETQGGPLWLQPQVVGRPASDGRITTPDHIRLTNLTSLAAGARGILYPRWRPLLDGPLFGAFGPYAMDGSRTECSQEASKVAKWANGKQQKALMQSVPVRGQVGIVVARESQLYSHLLSRESGFDFYADCMSGAYRGFFDNNIQADWVLVDHIADYNLLYLPYPIMLTGTSVAKLTEWVHAGGTLISEGCPAYFGDNCSVGTRQPNMGLDQLFGGVQESVSFMPDISDDIIFNLESANIRGGLYQQSYTPTSGTPIGRYPDGSVAALSHNYGAGKTILIGTFPSHGYHSFGEEANRDFFTWALAQGNKNPAVTVSNSSVYTRISEHEGKIFVWAFNPTDSVTKVRLDIDPTVLVEEVLWGDQDCAANTDDGIAASIPARDAVILALK